jgi:hypothetical protein
MKGRMSVRQWYRRVVTSGRINVAPKKHVEKSEPREDDQTRAQKG